MTEMHWFLEKGGGFLQNINRFGLEELQALFEENGLNEGADAAFLQISALLAPKPVTVDYFLQRDPYTKPEATKERFKGAQERGWITDLGDGNFGPTEKSVELTKKIFAILDDKLSAEELVPEEKAHKLFKLLRKVVVAATENKKAVTKAHLDFAANVKLHEGIHPLAKVRRMAIALFGYRDDCHHSAWLPVKDKGVVWDVFTQVWRGEEMTAAKLSEANTEYRTYTEEEYQKVLDKLTDKGWLAKEGDFFKITQAGEKVRQGVEDDTDAIFEIAFKALDEEETSKLKKLLDYAAEKLAHEEEPETTEA